MKKALRDILLIVVLFGAIVATPLVMQLLPSKDETAASKSAPEKPATETVTNAGKVTMDGMPPQPTPGGSGSAMDEVKSVDNVIPPPPPEDSNGGSMSIRSNDGAPVPTLLGDSDCPPIDLGAQQTYDPAIETRKTGDSFVMPASGTIQNTVDGGGGVDTVKVTDGGDVQADGDHLIHVEIYDLRNGQPNTLRVFAKGLANMNGRHAMVIGDPTGDTVLLDACLEWNDPISVNDGPEPLLRYDAHDKDGDQASVSVTEGVRVLKPVQK
jgi:hypothetical protein